MRHSACILLVLVLCPATLAAEPTSGPRAPIVSPALMSPAVATSPGQWTWAGGPDRIAESERLGTYGTKGVAAPENVPGARRGAATWVDGSGNFWLFGGSGFVRFAREGVLNDLWKWDGTSWTWVSGSNAYGRVGIYGTKGVAAPENVPGARYGAATWIDDGGNLWLFGGEGRGSVTSFDVALSDLWKWDGANWTWVSGPNVGQQLGVYGTKGVAAPLNRPGARREASAWRDASGSFWLFGGRGYASAGSGNKLLNDLWKWDGANWTWMSGSSSEQAGVYGTKGTASPANVPGGRYAATSSLDPDGRVWVHGGSGFGAASSGLLNDLWSWDGTSWTWVSGSDTPNQPGVYGTKGVAAVSNVPGARRSSASWCDSNGDLWLLGGSGFPSAGPEGSLNDLWKWNGASWTWIKGADTVGQTGVYGTKGLPGPANEPGGRYGAIVGKSSSGSVRVFGGLRLSAAYHSYLLNDLWLWDGSEWTWSSGSNGASEAGVYGTKGVTSPGSHPGARMGAVTWLAASGDAWLFGGYGFSATGEGYLNDLWRFDGSSWTWMSGTNREDQPGVFGTKGVPAATNVPGARGYSASWVDQEGNLWLFGGALGLWDQTLVNDLWKWDGTNWTWVSGSQNPGAQGVYGTKGVPAPTNVPGCRHSGVAWTGANGNLWLFGGNEWPGGPGAELNDLWRWDGTNWTWMSGANDGTVGGSYGALGVPAPENTPAGRVRAAAWIDQNGQFWLFGGTNYGYSQDHDDLWRWDGTNWTWMSGTPYGIGGRIYGSLGVSAPENAPGSRYGASSWTDLNGSLWLFGGYSPGWGDLNDLWRWDGVNWTWMSGSPNLSQPGVYGDIGVPASSNTPGGHYEAASWKDAQGRFRLWGGAGTDSTGAYGTLLDLWAYEPPVCTPPSAAMTAPDSILEASGTQVASVPDSGGAATYEWTIEGGAIDSGQGTPVLLFTATPGATNVVLSATVQKNGCAASWRKAIPIGVYHRLEVVRNGTGSDIVEVETTGYYPPEISCGLLCSTVFAHGSSVTLYARPGSSSRFAGWLGGGCAGTDPCTVTMTGPTTVSATFFQKAAARFYTLAPCRVVDTRNPAGSYGGPALEAGASRAFTIAGTCGVPSDANAVALNVTVTAPTEAGSLTLYPGTGPAPETGALHFAAGRTRANNVTMGLAGGVLSVLDRQQAGTVDFILDVSGYYR